MTLQDLAAGFVRRWHGLSRRHVAFAFGCACGAPAGHVSLTDLEGDILAYLRHHHPAAWNALVPVGSGEPSRLLDLLQCIAAMKEDPNQLLACLVADLERSMASCERAIAGPKRIWRADAVS